jgi:hypothetical protein
VVAHAGSLISSAALPASSGAPRRAGGKWQPQAAYQRGGAYLATLRTMSNV